MSKLTAKQQAFINEYVVDKNATQSAKAAGYSEKTAYSQWQRLLKNVEIKKKIDEKLQETARKAWISAERVIQWFIRNSEKAYEKWDISASNNALDKLGKHFGIYEEDNTQKSNVISIERIMYDSEW